MAAQDWIKAVGAKTANIEPVSPWENGYCESYNARFRDEFLNGENTTTRHDPKVLWAIAHQPRKPSSR